MISHQSLRSSTLASPPAICEFPSESEPAFKHLIGTSASFRAVLEEIRVVAPVDCSVLIEGETGTGKEVIAQALHHASPRRQRPFISLNCAALPVTLLENELFGHERGAFTGAVTQTTGRFGAAHTGVLFLDEVGELPLELQPKLLRVLQQQQFERLGSTRTIQVDVRLIAATNRNLGRLVQEGKFRADLYYRLNVFPIQVPPLRERREDIPALVHHFVAQYGERLDRSIEEIPAPVMEQLMSYSWPGNIRELQNVIERSVILSPDRVLILTRTALPNTRPSSAPSRPVRMLEKAERARVHKLGLAREGTKKSVAYPPTRAAG